MRVNVLCRNPNDDRVIPRFSRYLAEVNGWTLTARPEPGMDAYYLSGYFEYPVMRSGLPDDRPLAAYFTHREEVPANGSKARQFDDVARRVDLRIVTAGQYGSLLRHAGPTVQINPPVERHRFTIPDRRVNSKLVAGFSGYTYGNGRKGEDLAHAVVESPVGRMVSWQASGRGWPVPTKRYAWADMPAFYQSLDVLVITALVEGVPMPPLEALACGVSVVIPRGVGLLDDLESMTGIHRYERGNRKDLLRAFDEALRRREDADREALRAVTESYTIENWCAQHRTVFEELLDLEQPMSGSVAPVKAPKTVDTGERHPTRGIYCVAFGEPARACAHRMMTTVRQHMPEIPIAMAGAHPLGLEDVFIEVEDSDIGGRRAKLRAYELSPWETTLYLDVDTEVVSGDARFFFELIEDGWEFVIAKDPHLMDTMHSFRRPNNLVELRETAEEIHTLHTLQINGGVWAFGRNERVQAFFERWQAEYERHVQRDQGALIRALYADPLKVFYLGNEWNWFEKYSRGVEAAAIKHYPGRARRWTGLIPGRIDSDLAWSRVKQFERQRQGRGRRG